MKRFSTSFLVFGLLLVLGASITTAQTPVSIGFQGGLNFANATTDPSLSFSSRTGIMVGGSLEIGLSDLLFIQPEVLYVQKGAKFVIGSPSLSVEVVWKYDYIEVPLLLKAKFGANEFKPIIFAGPNIGFLLNAQGEATSGGQSASTDLKSLTESIDFALDFGAGLEYEINPTTSLTTSIRYSLGMSDIDNTASSSWKTNGVQVLAGARFSL